MAPAAATQLPDLWDDAHAASLDEPGLPLYRSNALGADLRIANFGGGNPAGEVDAAPKSTGDIINVDAGDAVSFTR
jgi:rhamnose utilization protein RhaD (predicted bifunctional aldolase and dehydrogenase)